tara:strand:- start:2274 stop:3203 length:930 start_codon:yes stop_codon:yes gene_type:complete
MNFFKPNFWDKNKISFFPILFFPLALLIQLIGMFKRLLTKTYQFSIPIICVGNIYLGGTGKTPLCIEIFAILKKLNMNPAFIRKKYDFFQDEVSLQKKIGAVYQGEKRVDAVNEAIKNGTNVAILDDGFQDFSLKKNLSIICFNGKKWVGNNFTIPAGPLRESLKALERAHCVIINGEKNIYIENKILNENKKIKIFYTKYKTQNIEEFKNKKVIAFAGIGMPENFFDLLEEHNINIYKTIKYPDHHNYSENELKNLIDMANENNAILLTTEKDHVKFSEDNKKKIKFLKISIEFENKSKFIEEIKKAI